MKDESVAIHVESLCFHPSAFILALCGMFIALIFGEHRALFERVR
jgi:hypothetical protein